jgi:hypothetical protein
MAVMSGSPGRSVAVDEAHNVFPAASDDPLLQAAADLGVLIAGEGRKFGLHLLVATQRPGKVHPNVVSQCDNLVLMRMNGAADVEELTSLFSHVPPRSCSGPSGSASARRYSPAPYPPSRYSPRSAPATHPRAAATCPQRGPPDVTQDRSRTAAPRQETRRPRTPHLTPRDPAAAAPAPDATYRPQRARSGSARRPSPVAARPAG